MNEKTKELEVPEFQNYKEEAEFWDQLDTGAFMPDDDQWFHFRRNNCRSVRELFVQECFHNVPAKDVAHQAVRNALDKDGWRITHDPLFISFAQVEMFIDLGAEPVIAAEKNERKIAVEIKSFLASSTISEFYTALGQFMSYLLALEAQHPGRVLYLAVPLDAYDQFFRLEFGQLAIQRYRLKLIVYKAESEEIIQWIE